MRRAFTLIELLVIVAIMATMVTVSVVSVQAGQSAARIKGATRDILAKIRGARSQALVLMQPAVVTYSTKSVDGVVAAQIEVEGAKIAGKSTSSETVQTLSGQPVGGEKAGIREDFTEESALKEGEGQTVEDILFSPISSDVVSGVRLKVLVGDEKLPTESAQKRGSRVSVFSNVDYLLGRYKEKKSGEEAKAKSEADSASGGEADGKSGPNDDQEPVSVVWEANGRCDPHRVFVYLDGSTPEKGLCIKVDRFGAAKVVSGDEREEED